MRHDSKKTEADMEDGLKQSILIVDDVEVNLDTLVGTAFLF
jgi:hypothetical protein